MRAQCIQSVEQAIGRSLRVGEAADIEARIRQAMKDLARQDRQAWQQMTADQRLIEAGKKVGVDLVAEAIRKQQILASDIVKQARNLSMLDDTRIQIPAMERLDRLIAFHGDMAGILSINSQARAIAAVSLGRLHEMFAATKGKALGIFHDKAMTLDVVREMFGQSTGNATAKTVAKTVQDVMEDLRIRFNNAGGNIGKLDSFGMPQTHSTLKVSKAGQDTWVNSVMPKLDRERYVNEDGTLMTDAQVKALLDEAYLSIATNGANKIEPLRQNGGRPGSSKRTNRNSESRVLHFNGADNWIAYQREFGDMQFHDVIEAHIQGISKDIALIEGLGSNPNAALRILLDTAEKKETLANPDGANKVGGQRNRIEVMFNELSGLNVAANGTTAAIWQAYRNWNIASMLGGATLSAVTDPAMMARTASINRLAFSKVFGEMLSQINPARKEDRQLARSLGLGVDEMLNSLTRYADDGLASVAGKAGTVNKFSRGLASQLIRASGLNALTAANKTAFSKILMNKYGELSRSKDWNSLHADDRALLEAAGLKEQDWQVYQLAQPVIDRKGNQLMSAESIYQIPDAQLLQFGDPKRIKDEVSTRFMAHILDEQGMAVIEAGLRERTLLMGNVKKGTAIGEVVRSMTQFKSFVSAYLLRHGSRMMSRPGATGKAYYLTSLLTMTTLLGALAAQLKSMASGNDPYDMTEPDFWYKRAIPQGGGLGILSDILVAGEDPQGRGISDVMLGPFGSKVKDLSNLTISNPVQAWQGKNANAASETIRFVKGNTPFANLWYTKAATDHLLFNQMQEHVSPGYLRKMQRKAEKQQDRTMWWDMDDMAPDSAPDFEKAVGE